MKAIQNRYAVQFALCCAAVGALLFAAPTPSHADEIVQNVAAAAFEKKSPADTTLGDYYILQIAPPAQVLTGVLIDAYVEFDADVSTTLDATFAAGLATLEVFVLASVPSGEVRSSDLAPNLVMRQHVPIGANRRVRVRITDAVLHTIKNPEHQFGLVIGSLSGKRYGHFGLKTGKLSGGARARVTYVFDPPMVAR